MSESRTVIQVNAKPPLVMLALQSSVAACRGSLYGAGDDHLTCSVPIHGEQETSVPEDGRYIHVTVDVIANGTGSTLIFDYEVHYYPPLYIGTDKNTFRTFMTVFDQTLKAHGRGARPPDYGPAVG